MASRSTISAGIPAALRARADRRVRLIIGVWLVAVAGGWCYITRDALSSDQHESNHVVDSWPADSALPRATERPTLLVFLHPKCPCSRASLKELRRTLDAATTVNSPAPALLVIATVPQAADQSWWQTETVELARGIANAQVHVDRGGREAARFGATTSGMVMLFDPSGQRLYSGGTTIARGHIGASTGGDRLAELLRGDTNQAIDMPTFGCRLCLPLSETADDIADFENQDEEHSASSI
jgi:hypothetical protein